MLQAICEFISSKLYDWWRLSINPFCRKFFFLLSITWDECFFYPFYQSNDDSEEFDSEEFDSEEFDSEQLRLVDHHLAWCDFCNEEIWEEYFNEFWNSEDLIDNINNKNWYKEWEEFCLVEFNEYSDIVVY